MTVLSPQLERTLIRPWWTAGALAVLFVALQDLAAVVNLLIFFISPGVEFGDDSLRWEIVRDEWSIHLTFLLIGMVAAYVLQLAARSNESYAWPQLVLRAAILFVPATIVVNFVVSFAFALVHNESFQFFGIEVLG